MFLHRIELQINNLLQHITILYIFWTSFMITKIITTSQPLLVCLLTVASLSSALNQDAQKQKYFKHYLKK